MFDTAKSGAVQMQKIALKAATEAASAAAEAAVRAVMMLCNRENASSRPPRGAEKGQNRSSVKRGRKDTSASAIVQPGKPTRGYARRLSVF